MSGKPFFIVITSKICGACQRFYTIWDPIKKAIQNTGKVEIKEIQLPDMNTNNLTQKGYPAQLGKHITHFPFFMLVSRKKWNEATKDSKTELEPIKLQPNEYNFLSEEGLIKFVNDKIPLLEASKSPRTPRNFQKLLSDAKSPQTSGNEKQIPTYGSHIAMCKKWNIKPKYVRK
jgi:hypothetical protein